jgi:hypothetical protein
MAINYQNQLTASVTASTTVYNPTTVGVQCTLIGLLIANTTTSTITAIVTLNSGATTVNIVKNVVIPPGTSLDVVQAAKIIVERNDVLAVSATGAVDVLVSAIEVS